MEQPIYLLISIGLGIFLAAIFAFAYKKYLKAQLGDIKREREQTLKEAERDRSTLR